LLAAALGAEEAAAQDLVHGAVVVAARDAFDAERAVSRAIQLAVPHGDDGAEGLLAARMADVDALDPPRERGQAKAGLELFELGLGALPPPPFLLEGVRGVLM